MTNPHSNFTFVFFIKVAIAGISTYLAAIFSYPWVVTKEMVDLWPKQKGAQHTFNGSYRKAGVWLWYHEFAGTYFAGFFTKYFWKTAPNMCITLLLAEKAGLFKQTVVDNFSGQGNNTWEDVNRKDSKLFYSLKRLQFSHLFLNSKIDLHMRNSPKEGKWDRC